MARRVACPASSGVAWAISTTFQDDDPPWIQFVAYFFLPSGNLTYLLKMTIEIVDLPIKKGDFP